MAQQVGFSCQFDAYGRDLSALRDDAEAYFGEDAKIMMTIGTASPHQLVSSADGTSRIIEWEATCKANILEAS